MLDEEDIIATIARLLEDQYGEPFEYRKIEKQEDETA